MLHENLIVRQKLSIGTKWHITEMNNAGLSCRETAQHVGWNNTVISRLVRKYQQTNNVKDRNRPGQHRKLSPRGNGTLLRPVRRCAVSSNTILRDNWDSTRVISTSTVKTSAED